MRRKIKSERNRRLDAGAFRKLLPSLGAPSQARLLKVLCDSSLRGKIPAAEIQSIIKSERISADELMIALLPVAQTYSHSPLSHYQVGAVALGKSGSFYLGTNIEVPGQILGFAVHGEQCAVSNALTHEEGGITSLAVTAPPCGHCRQFLNELANSASLKILVKGRTPTTLARLLPDSFGPNELNVKERLLSGKKANLKLTTPTTDALPSAGLHAADKSYAPYTRALSGVAVMSSTGVVYHGSYIESAAYNPSLSPLQAALVGMIMAGEKPGNISAVTLVELANAPISQMSASRAVLDGLAPAATLRRMTARLK